MGQVITVAQQKGGAGKTTLAANLAIALQRQGHSVAIVDIDPQGSLGRWFMTRIESRAPDLEFATASAWGAGFELKKLKRVHDFILVDTPPKVDSDLRPSLRESDLVLVPVATSQVDVWALDAILDLAERERVPALVVLNRFKRGTRLSDDVTATLDGRDVERAETVIGDRVAYAESLGRGESVLERGKGAWTTEMVSLRDEVQAALETLAEPS